MMITQKEQNSRIEIIDVLRGIAILLMILGHSFIVYPVNIADVSWCKAIQHWIYTFHMELFFFLAGAVYHCSNFCKFVKNKLLRLGVPYLFFGVLTLCMHIFGGNLVHKNISVKEGIFAFIFYGGSYWFLYTLFFVFLLYPLIDKFCNTNIKKILFALLIIGINSIFNLPSLFTIDKIFYYLPYFMLGRILSNLNVWQKLSEDWNAYGLWCKSIAKIGLMSGLLILFIIFDMIENEVNKYFLPTILTLRAICMIFLLGLFISYLLKISKESKIKSKIIQFMSLCSVFSLQLYLFNGYLLVVFRFIICSILHISNPILIVLCIWIGNIIVAIPLCLLLEKIPFVSLLCGLKLKQTRKNNQETV